MSPIGCSHPYIVQSSDAGLQAVVWDASLGEVALSPGRQFPERKYTRAVTLCPQLPAQPSLKLRGDLGETPALRDYSDCNRGLNQKGSQKESLERLPQLWDNRKNCLRSRRQKPGRMSQRHPPAAAVFERQRQEDEKFKIVLSLVYIRHYLKTKQNKSSHQKEEGE